MSTYFFPEADGPPVAAYCQLKVFAILMGHPVFLSIYTLCVIGGVRACGVVVEVSVVVAVGVGALLDLLHEGVDQGVHLKRSEAFRVLIEFYGIIFSTRS